MGFNAGAGIAGYRYYFSIHCGIGRGPIDQLREIRMGGKLGWQGDVHGGVSEVGSIDQPSLFGGDNKEGGIQGVFQCMMGEPTQMPGAPLQAFLLTPAGAAVTGFRRMVTFFFDGMVAALNPYPKPWSFRVRRAINGWDGDVLAPELAVIELLGQTTLPPEDTRPINPLGSAQALIPLTNTASMTFAVSAPIDMDNPGSLRHVTSTGVDETYTEYPFNLTKIDDYTYKIDVPCYLYGDPNLQFVYTPKPEFGLYPRTVSPIALSSYNSYARMKVIFGTMNPGSTLFDLGTSLATPGDVIDWSIVETDLPGGNWTVRLPAMYYGKTLLARVNIPGLGLQNFNFLVDDLENPAHIELPHRAGETLVEITGYTVHDNSPLSNATEDDPNYIPPGRNPPWNITDYDAWGVDIYDIYGEGYIRNFRYSYKPFFGQLFLTPDPVIKAMNPAHILYECYTNTEWGRSFPRDLINEDSFIECAQSLFDEGFGLCLKWSRRDGIKAFIQNVLDTIGAVVYMDPELAQLTLKLIRGDYTKGDLKLWTTSNGILTIKEAKTNGGGSVINEVVVNFKDPVFNEERWVGEQNIASIQASKGAINSLKKDYPGIPIPALARRVALRDLRAQSQGIRRFSLVMDRRAWRIRPGHVIRVQDAARFIPDMALRVTSTKDGTTIAGSIEIEAIQDVFSFPNRSFTQEQPPRWTPADFTPCIGEHEVFEAPYWLLARSMRPADFAYVGEGSAYIATVAEKGQPKNTDYSIAVRDSAPTSDDVPLPADQLYCGYQP